MMASRMPLVLSLLLTGCGPAGCEDKSASTALEKVGKLEQVVGGLEQRINGLEARLKAEQGPTQEDLSKAIADIDASSRAAPGTFKANAVMIDSTKLGNGDWQVVFGRKDGAGPRAMAIVKKTATGWEWDRQPLRFN